MKQNKPENILTVATKLAFRHVIDFVGLKRTTDTQFGEAVKKLIYSCGPEYLPRTLQLEEDLNRLQPIPYIAVRTKDGRYVTYARYKGGEARLEGRISIGLGGHVNDTDKSSSESYPSDIWNGAIRELSEKDEVSLPPDHYSLAPFGICYLPTSPENVHLGLFMTATLNDAGLSVIEKRLAQEEIAKKQYFTRLPDLYDVMQKPNTEVWTRYFIQLLLQQEA